ncbi:MAG: isopentenyl-diphosphate Delta-isomerase [Bacteroidota bacterium]
MEKMEAHKKGVLHRAFSVLLFDGGGRILLQKRASKKYHSSGLWTNTCCSHPAPGEKMEDAVRRRLLEEMGIDLQPEFAYKFIYRANLDQGLIEHEFDHVFIGTFDGEPDINHEEVEDWKFVALDWLKKDIGENPGRYTYWFKLIIEHPALPSMVS